MNALAIDLGSSSARLMLVDSEYRITELCRVPHSAYLDANGHYRWDINRLFDSIIVAIDDAISRNEIASIGICSWGVDYGVIKADGTLLDDPYCYRDNRNVQAFEEYHRRIDGYESFRKGGIYPLAINTVYQLLADIKDNRYDGEAVQIALIADLLAYRLTGNIRAELANASTTQLLNSKGDEWDYDAIKDYGIDVSIFPKVISSGEVYGEHNGVKVIAVGTHDTASAIFAMGEFAERDAFLSSGSWLLLGKLLEQPLMGRKIYDIGYTNERVCDGKVSLLINMNGLFVIQRVVAESGITYKDIDEHIDSAKVLGVLDTDKLQMQEGMIDAINHMLNVTNADIFDIAKTIYFSLAYKLSKALADLSKVTNSVIKRIVLSGGASKAKYFLKYTRELCGVEIDICAGEGAVLGNAMRQFKALNNSK